MVQQRVNVMEDVLSRDSLVAVVLLEMLEREERNVVLALLAVLAVGVRGKAIGSGTEARSRN